MKWIFVMLTIYSTNLLAQSKCHGLRLDLLAIEGKIQNSRLDKCTDGQTTSCMPLGDITDKPKAKYYHQIVNDYNKAMAKLIIQQGIQTIGKAVEANHNYLGAMKETKVSSAEKYLADLELNLQKSELIDAALNPVPIKMSDDHNDLTSFWHKHGFDLILQDLNEDTFKNKMQVACGDKVTSDSSKLCAALPSKEDGTINYDIKNELNKTLYGYAIAEMQQRANVIQLDEGYYTTQRNKLKIIDGESKKPLTAKEFKEVHFGNNGKLALLKNNIKKYNDNKNEKNAKAIFLSATELDTISVQYNYNPEENSESKLVAFYDKHFAKPLSNFDITDTLTTDLWKNNLQNHTDKVLNDSKIAKRSMELEAEVILKSIPKITCKKNQTSLECIKSACKIDSKNKKSCKNPAVIEVDKNFISNLSKLESLDSFSSQIQEVQGCYTKKTLDLKKKCLLEQGENLQKDFGNTSGTKLKNEVKKAKDLLTEFNNGQPFRDLKMEKALALSALQKTNCNRPESLLPIKYACKEGLEIEDQTVLSLGSDLRDITISLEKDLLKRADGDTENIGTSDQRLFVEHKKAYLENCKNPASKPDTKELCDYFKRDEESTAARLEKTRIDHINSQNKIKKRNAVRRSRKTDGPTPLGSFASGFGQGLVVSSPLLVTTWAQHDSTKTWQKQQLGQIASMEKAYTRRMEYYDWLKDNNYSGTSYNASNWGAGYYNNSYDYNSTFQSENTGSIYNNMTNPYQFSFSGPITTSDFTTNGNTNFGDYSSGFSSNQSYEFSF